MAEDSGLSVAANVAGLSTLGVAIIAAIWLRINQLAGYKREYERGWELLLWTNEEIEYSMHLESVYEGEQHHIGDGSDTSQIDGKYERVWRDKRDAIRKRGALIPRLRKVLNAMLMVNKAYPVEYPNIYKRIIPPQAFTDGIRLNTGRKLPFLRHPLNLSVLRDWIVEGEALKAEVATLDSRILRLQMLENKILRDQEKVALQEIRDLLKHLKESRAPPTAATLTTEDKASVQSHSSAPKHDEKGVAEEEDIALQTRHNLESHISTADMTGPLDT